MLGKHTREENRKRRGIQNCFTDNYIRWPANIGPFHEKRSSEKPPSYRYDSLLSVYQNNTSSYVAIPRVLWFPTD